MWRAQAGRSVSVTNDSDSDDWDTNPDYENEVDDKGTVDIILNQDKMLVRPVHFELFQFVSTSNSSIESSQNTW